MGSKVFQFIKHSGFVPFFIGYTLIYFILFGSIFILDNYNLMAVGYVMLFALLLVPLIIPGLLLYTTLRRMKTNRIYWCFLGVAIVIFLTHIGFIVYTFLSDGVFLPEFIILEICAQGFLQVAICLWLIIEFFLGRVSFRRIIRPIIIVIIMLILLSIYLLDSEVILYGSYSDIYWVFVGILVLNPILIDVVLLTAKGKLYELHEPTEMKRRLRLKPWQKVALAVMLLGIALWQFLLYYPYDFTPLFQGYFEMTVEEDTMRIEGIISEELGADFREVAFGKDKVYGTTYRYEVVSVDKTGAIEVLSREGDVEWNHLGQIFYRDVDKVYEVMEGHTELRLEADELRNIWRVDNTIYYTGYLYESPDYVGQYQLRKMDLDTGIDSLIDNIHINWFHDYFYYETDVIYDGDRLIYLPMKADADIGIYSFESESSDYVYFGGLMVEGWISDLILDGDRLYFHTTDYSDIPSYGVDCISSTSSPVDYCYDIATEKFYKGELKLEVVNSDAIQNLMNELDYEFLGINPVRFNVMYYDYIERPVIEVVDIELPQSLMDDGNYYYETVLMAKIESSDYQLLYSDNHKNVLRYGEPLTEPLFTMEERHKDYRYVYVMAYDPVTGLCSEVVEYMLSDY